MWQIFWKIKKFDYNNGNQSLVSNKIPMTKKSNSWEKPQSNGENRSAFPGWKKVVTAVALLWALSSCNNDMKSNEIKLDPEDESVKFKVEYRFSEWSAGYNKTVYDMSVHKEWDTYMWLIEQNGDYVQKTTTIESDNLDKVFDEILETTDSEQITDNTRAKRDAKVQFVKDAYKKHVLDAKDWKNSDPIILKYKSK